MTLEKLAKQIFDECAKEGEPITEDEALEMAQMEINAKGINKGARAINPKAEKEKKPKVVQVSQEKQELFSEIYDYLCETMAETDRKVEILKENKLISVKIGEKSFKIDIIEQRKAK